MEAESLIQTCYGARSRSVSPTFFCTSGTFLQTRLEAAEASSFRWNKRLKTAELMSRCFSDLKMKKMDADPHICGEVMALAGVVWVVLDQGCRGFTSSAVDTGGLGSAFRAGCEMAHADRTGALQPRTPRTLFGWFLFEGSDTVFKTPQRLTDKDVRLLKLLSRFQGDGSCLSSIRLETPGSPELPVCLTACLFNGSWISPWCPR